MKNIEVGTLVKFRTGFNIKTQEYTYKAGRVVARGYTDSGGNTIWRVKDFDGTVYGVAEISLIRINERRERNGKR